MRVIVYGHPAPQGSKKFVGVAKSTGRGILVESSKRVKPWRQDVKAAAIEARKGAAPLDGPLRVRMVFTLPKPKSAPKRRRTYPDRKPDLDKLCRSTLDSLVESGVIADDARVIELTLLKVFPCEHEESLEIPGVVITVRTLDASTQEGHGRTASLGLQEASQCA